MAPTAGVETPLLLALHSCGGRDIKQGSMAGTKSHGVKRAGVRGKGRKERGPCRRACVLKMMALWPQQEVKCGFGPCLPGYQGWASHLQPPSLSAFRVSHWNCEKDSATELLQRGLRRTQASRTPEKGPHRAPLPLPIASDGHRCPGGLGLCAWQCYPRAMFTQAKRDLSFAQLRSQQS